jgi:ABC-type multidrug transport system ATPase subunit
MSVAGHLRIFCQMNGLDGQEMERYIDLLLDSLGILSFKNYATQNLSGGTKRKVSSAIALMLPRALVVMDESSTGLDPLARHKLWNTVRLLNNDRTTIMTTHYVEETSACDRIGIMSKGKMICCDTEHRLTQGLTKGYKLLLFFGQMPDNLSQFLSQNLAKSGELEFLVENIVDNVAEIKLTLTSITLATVIARLTGMKRNQAISSFGISRTSMEQVFLDLVHDSEEESNKPKKSGMFGFFRKRK